MISNESLTHSIKDRSPSLETRSRPVFTKPCFDAIIVTASSERQSTAFTYELEIRKKRGSIPSSTLVLSVPDPHGNRIGSGGATINALLSLAEEYSGIEGKAFIDTGILKDKKICIIHSGGDSRRSPCQSVCGKAWSYLPSVDSRGDVTAPIDHLINSLSLIFANVDNGVIVSCSDVSLILPTDCNLYDWSKPGVTGLAIASPKAYGPNHGVYVLKGKKIVENFLQKPSLSTLASIPGAILDGENVALDSGVIFIDSNATDILLSKFLTKPLDASTYIGSDRGANAIRIELYSDLIIPLQSSDSLSRISATTKEEYISMDDTKSKDLMAARVVLWEILGDIKMHVNMPENGSFAHVGTTKEYIEFVSGNEYYKNFIQEYKMENIVASYVTDRILNKAGSIVNSCVNSIRGEIGSGSVIENCNFSHPKAEWIIGENCLVSGVRSAVAGGELASNLVMYETTLANEDGKISNVIAIFGVFDDVKSDYRSAKSTFCNISWKIFMERSLIEFEDLWGHIEKQEIPSLWNARVFPVLDDSNATSYDWIQLFSSQAEGSKTRKVTQNMRWLNSKRVSFADISAFSVPINEIDYKRELGLKIDLLALQSSLTMKSFSKNLHNICSRASSTSTQLSSTLAILDNVASNASLDILARTYTVIADVLASSSKTHFSLRAGHANNKCFKLNLVKETDIPRAVLALATERDKWLSSPDLCIRASRHYEKASQLTIAKAVWESKITFKKHTEGLISWSSTVLSTAPARVDLAGGWTDTPPITYEAGSQVLNAAITLDNKCPFSVKIKRNKKPILELNSLDTVISIETLADMADYDQPNASGALFKCVILSMGIITLSSKESLADQLIAKLGGGLEIWSESDMPPGSGLGGSSILAATIVGALARAVGRVYSLDGISQIVLTIEQMLTTGGGWQDQVGGIFPGVKLCHSPATIPIQLFLKYEDEFRTSPHVQELSDRLVLVYTGVARLAKTLLQDVLRRWYLAEEGIVQNAEDLVQNAAQSAKELLNGNIEGVGKCLSLYWKQKQKMAPNSRPIFVAELEDALLPLCYGISLAGAGGGGFMICITREKKAKNSIVAKLKEMNLITPEMKIYEGSIHTQGLLVEVKG